MAKKKKVQKQSIKKRQLNKSNKRKLLKKKQSAQKSPQKQMSMAKAKKNLKALPSLIFEPELAALGFDTATLDTARAASELLPEQIDFAAAQDDFETKFLEALKEMDGRFENEQNANKRMMTQAMLYFLDQKQTPACLNQLIVSLFLNGLQQEKTSEGYDFAGLSLALKDYDTEHEAYLEQRTNQLAETAAAEETNQTALETDLETTPFIRLLSKIEGWSQSSEIEEDEADRLTDDLTALFEDYAGEKEWNELSDVTPKRVQSFMGWFEQKMNPTPADLKQLKSSLLTFFSAPLAETEFGPQTCGTILATL